MGSSAAETGNLVVAVTGASGSLYAQRLLLHARKHFERIYVMMSEQAVQVAGQELGIGMSVSQPNLERFVGEPCPNVSLLEARNYFTPPASGSFRHDGMVIVPCSMGTAGRIANGISNDLCTRAADVCLKERRRLILVPREMPWNLIHLRNFTQLAEAGAVVLPACPAFYYRPQSLEELADTVVARILQQLGINHQLVPQWQSEDAE
jgi:4-hydroxy-3-polyprenylbenzoate decarboxylase